jgi:hypothetical protein
VLARDSFGVLESYQTSFDSASGKSLAFVLAGLTIAQTRSGEYPKSTHFEPMLLYRLPWLAVCRCKVVQDWSCTCGRLLLVGNHLSAHLALSVALRKSISVDETPLGRARKMVVQAEHPLG